jgi:hypothetical protein
MCVGGWVVLVLVLVVLVVVVVVVVARQRHGTHTSRGKRHCHSLLLELLAGTVEQHEIDVRDSELRKRFVDRFDRHLRVRCAVGLASASSGCLARDVSARHARCEEHDGSGWWEMGQV